MNKHITIAAFLVAGAALANAGTTYWWESGKTNGLEDHEFGAIDGTKTNWSNTDGTSWVVPVSYDTLDALKAGITPNNHPQKDTNGNSPENGIDFVFGGDATSVDVNKFYYVSGLSSSSAYASSGNITFNFGEVGAIYSRYQTNFSSKFASLTLNVSLSGSGERVLFSTADALIGSGYSYSTLTASDDFFSTTTLKADGYTVLDGVYKDKETLSLNAGEAALVYQNNTISVVYSAVPEPSAFGLLAGLGALALVAACRRRGRKA